MGLRSGFAGLCATVVFLLGVSIMIYGAILMSANQNMYGLPGVEIGLWGATVACVGSFLTKSLIKKFLFVG